MLRWQPPCPKRSGIPWLLLLSTLLGGQAASADSTPEYQLKAAYLFNFAKFTEWPAASLPAGAPVTICIAGRDPFGDALAGLESKMLQSRPVRVRRGVHAEDLRGCQIVFITDNDERRMQDLLRAAESASTLTLSDIDGFVEQGGMIGLITRENRILFDVNFDMTHRANVKLSSQVLKLARSVRGRP